MTYHAPMGYNLRAGNTPPRGYSLHRTCCIGTGAMKAEPASERPKSFASPNLAPCRYSIAKRDIDNCITWDGHSALNPFSAGDRVIGNTMDLPTQFWKYQHTDGVRLTLAHRDMMSRVRFVMPSGLAFTPLPTVELRLGIYGYFLPIKMNEVCQ